MKRAIPLIFAVFASWTHADNVQQEPATPLSFDARLRLAQEAETDERFKSYPPAMLRRAGPHLARTMRRCIATSPKPPQKSVTLVADISADGRATAIEVKPDNAVAKCVAAGVAAAKYRKPPAYPGRTGFPVTVKMRVVR